jgi:hypothetical protein
MPFNKSTRSYLFRELASQWRPGPLSWRDARLMFKGATVAAILKAERALAFERAKMDRAYVARQNRDGRWIVWDCKSDHAVEFN